MATRISKKIWPLRATMVVVSVALVVMALSCGPLTLSEAPDFTLPTLAGGNVTLSEMKSNPVVLNFWTTTCPYCVQQLPYLESIAQQGTGKIQVMAVNVGQNSSTVRNFFGDYEPTMVVPLDTTGQVFASYCQKYENPGKIPFTLFVGSDGLVRYKRIGAFTSEAELRDKINSVLGITIP